MGATESEVLVIDHRKEFDNWHMKATHSNGSVVFESFYRAKELYATMDWYDRRPGWTVENLGPMSIDDRQAARDRRWKELGVINAR